MVAIQVVPLEPDDWSDAEAAPGQPTPRRLQTADWRPLPDRSTRVRRRRLGVLLVAAVALAGTAALVDVVVSGTPSSSEVPDVVPDAGPGPITDDVYVVQPGDTLWSIAQRLAPDKDPRPVVAKLRELNGGVELEVGDRVRVGDV